MLEKQTKKLPNSNSKLFLSYQKQTIKNDLDKISLNENNLQTISSSNEEENNKSHENFNNGRWSEEEHKKFLEGILEYGNEWKKVQKVIKTRSSTQARSHAQKFFLKIKKNVNELNFENKNNLNIDFNEIIKYIVATLNNQQCKEIVLNEKQREKLLKIIHCKNNENDDNLNDKNFKLKLKEDIIKDKINVNKNNYDIICKKRKRRKSTSSKIFNISKNSSHKNSFESNIINSEKNINFDYENCESVFEQKINNEEKTFNNQNPFNLEFKFFNDDDEEKENNHVFKYGMNEKENNNFIFHQNTNLNNQLNNFENNFIFDISDNKNTYDFSLISPQNI